MLDVRLIPLAPSHEPIVESADAGELRESAGRLARGLPPGVTTLARPGLAGERLSAFVEGLLLGGYTYTQRSAPLPSRSVELAGVDDVDAFERGRRRAAATMWARDLANTPSATKTPAWLGAQAERVLGPLGVAVDVHDESWLAAQGFGGVLAVGAGSAAPPRLIEAQWRPGGARAGEHVVLVGKGITFDTGGLNLKLGDGMQTMKTDMSGGAAVLAALRIIAAANLPLRVTALVPAAENSLSGSAMRPSDVIRHVGGRTSEVANTDAEGRLVLADALAYAVARLRASTVVDIATLTGAMRVALGLRTAGLFATSDPLAGALSAAGDAMGEPLWRMPLDEDYTGTLHSDIADANNSPGNPGAITAALFLKPFVGAVPWAHLDIAGPARAGADDGLRALGATGFGARLLARWVASSV